MDLKEYLAMALRSLRAKPLRSGLSMLGVIIGVAAVVALMSAGRGAKRAAEREIGVLGNNILFVVSGRATTPAGLFLQMGTAQTLSYQDALDIADPYNCPSVALVSPETTRLVQVVRENENVSTYAHGVTPEWITIRSFEVAQGEPLNAAHIASNARVTVLGAQVARSLFGDEDAVGQFVRIGNVSLQVIGVLEARGGSGSGGHDDMLLVPITTYWAYLERLTVRGGNAVTMIDVQAVDEASVDSAAEEIRVLLRQAHRLRADEDDDFEALSQVEMISRIDEILGIITALVSGVGAIALVVAGVSIMNIMLVSVAERTREIGLRMAVGARPRDIRRQFLIESALLSALGGAFGLFLAGALVAVIEIVSVRLGTPIDASLGLDSVAVALIASSVVGLTFGTYPAVRAAQLRPIEALAHE